jgi:hypothetical protein
MGREHSTIRIIERLVSIFLFFFFPTLNVTVCTFKFDKLKQKILVHQDVLSTPLPRNILHNQRVS